MSARPRQRVPENQSSECPNRSNQQTLGDKHPAHLGFASAHRHEHGDIARLFHHHHRQRDQNIQRGHEHDQADGNKRDQPFQSESAKQRLILLHPVGSHEAFAGNPFELL